MNTTFKFGLTLAAAVVLTACGSSGGKSNNTTSNTTADTTTPAVVTPTTPATPTETVSLVQDTAVEYGGKFVKKDGSNFRVPGTNGTHDSSGAATAMTVALYPSLDTVVIASQTDNQGNAIAGADIIYLEDFDFRGNDAYDKLSTGKAQLSDIYKGTGTAAKTATAGLSTARDAGHQSVTKTPTKGTQTGTVLVYSPNVADSAYVQRSILDRAPTGTPPTIAAGTVAEVYGYRTFVKGDAGEGYDYGSTGALPVSKPTAGEVDQANTPLIKARLYNVQYGRVTSSLDGLVESDLKVGLAQGAYSTRIASYAEFGSDKTEDSYFFRGVNPTAAAMKKNGADLVTALKEKYADGKIKYAGHAVTYGFTHEYTANNVVQTAAGVPNAIGSTNTTPAVTPVLKSGTHVDATVNLNNYNVSGRLYDVYKVGINDKAVGLATFTGTLTNYGNVEGTSTRTADSAEGSFKATLYGVNATELGGAISSNKTTAGDSWGAVFGAKAGAATGIGVATDSNKASE